MSTAREDAQVEADAEHDDDTDNSEGAEVEVEVEVEESSSSRRRYSSKNDMTDTFGGIVGIKKKVKQASGNGTVLGLWGSRSGHPHFSLAGFVTTHPRRRYRA